MFPVQFFMDLRFRFLTPFLTMHFFPSCSHNFPVLYILSSSLVLAAGSPGGAADGHIPCQMLPDWQESTEAGGMEQPSCSTYTQEIGAGNSSRSQISTKPAFGFPAVSERPQCDTDQASPASKLQIIVVRSRAYAAQDSCGSALSAGYGGDDVEEVSPLTCQGITAVRSQWQPLRCVQIQEPAADVMLEGNATHSNHISFFSSPAVTVGTVNSRQQQAQHSQSGIQPGGEDHISSQNRCYPASRSQNQELGLTQQQPCLPYVCSFCSRRYAHQCQLRIHERSHTGEKPYQCAQCGKSFGQVCSLRRHQMVHTGERPFPCPHCGKQFSTSTNLKVHQSVHTGEKKFHCSKCGKNFSFLSNLIRHQALHADK